VNRRLFRSLLISLLALVSAFAVWTWFRPYAGDPDPNARFTIEAAEVIRDASYYWINLHLKRNGEADHDLQKDVRLVLGDGHELEPADTSLVGSAATGVSDIWLRFWLNEDQLNRPLTLRLNGGSLTVKSTTGQPTLKPNGKRVFTSHRW
jgi:hypothetical protein